MPEVLLLFKAKHLPPKDEQDFDAVVSNMQPQSRDWLRTALAATHPERPWFKCILLPLNLNVILHSKARV